MASSTGPALIAGAITVTNELIFAPIDGEKVSFNWRVVPATALWALALAGLEKAAPAFAVGLAWLGVATVLIVPFGNAQTPLQNANKVLGFTGKVVNR